jgi:hypothetical protein
MIALVLMILAAVVFLLRVLTVEVGDLDLIALGLTLMAAAFVAAWYWGVPRYRTAP